MKIDSNTLERWITSWRIDNAMSTHKTVSLSVFLQTKMSIADSIRTSIDEIQKGLEKTIEEHQQYLDASYGEIKRLQDSCSHEQCTEVFCNDSYWKCDICDQGYIKAPECDG